MEEQNPKASPSFHAFIKKTAQMLREATKSPKSRKRKFTKKTELSNKNKIEQIALLIRSESKKAKKTSKEKN